MRKLLFILFMLPIALSAQTDSLTEKLDSFLHYLLLENRFSGHVALSKGDQIIYDGTFNMQSNRTEEYRIGSVTKVFTAIMIYQLIEEQKLSLNTTLDKFYPMIKHASDITIEKMLSHTSGIFNVTEKKDYYATRTKKFSHEEMIELIRANKPAFKPGKDCEYSNANYILLGYIVEKLTGKSYQQNLEERITGPLKLKHTCCETSASDPNEREQCYKYNGEEWQEDVDTEPSFPGGSGAIVSDPEDLCKLMNALMAQKIISDSALKTMMTLANRTTGHGLFLSSFYDKKGWGHSGRIDEFRSFAGFIPEDSLCIALTSNGINMKQNDVLIGLLSIYYNKEFTFPTYAPIADVLPATDRFTGNYRVKLFGFIPVATFHLMPAGKNHLFMTTIKNPEASERVLLERRDTMVFYAADLGGLLTFEDNGRGKVKRIRMKQGKMELKVKRIG